MYITIAMLIISLILCYANLSFIFGWFYPHIFQELNAIFYMLNGVALKWSGVFALFGLIYSVYSLITKAYKSEQFLLNWQLLALYVVLLGLTLL